MTDTFSPSLTGAFAPTLTTDCFVVVGYNNTRVYDVAELRHLCHRHYRAHLVLVTERPAPQDHTAADVVLTAPLGEVDPATAAAPIGQELRRRGLRPVGVLPFSDRGVPLGACLARHLSPPGVDPAHATAGLDKRRFHSLEAAALAHPAHYTPCAACPYTASTSSGTPYGRWAARPSPSPSARATAAAARPSPTSASASRCGRHWSRTTPRACWWRAWYATPARSSPRRAWRVGASTANCSS